MEVQAIKRSFVSTALLLLGMASSLFANSPAQLPYFTGRIEQDTTWHDTVYVGGDVTIAAAATLTLAPNTQVLFLPYHDDTRSGLDSTRAELTVEGRLAAQAGGIVFRSADAGSLGADWHGLVVERGGRADVSNAAIRDGLRCLYAKMGGFVTMDALAFANCGKPTAPADAAKTATPEERARKEDFPKIGGQETTSTTRRIISKLIMGGLSHSAATRDSTQADSGVSSLTVNERHRPFDIENGGLRLLAKVGAGTVSGIAFTALSIPVQAAIYQPSGDPDADFYRGVAFLLAGAAIGCSVGFPFGVSSVDPYDSLPKTLLAGVIPGAVGFSALLLNQENGDIASFFVYVVPVISSPIVSELSRKPPQARRVSFALSPTLNGGLSAVAQLRF